MDDKEDMTMASNYVSNKKYIETIKMIIDLLKTDISKEELIERLNKLIEKNKE